MAGPIVKIPSRDLAHDAAKAIKRAIEMLERESTFRPPEGKTVILPVLNSPTAGSPKNTSSTVIGGAAEALKRLNAEVSIGGNPPKALPGPQMLDLFEKTGITAIVNSLGISQLLDQRTMVVPLRTGRTAKFFVMAQYLTGGVSPIFVPRLRADDLLMFGAVRGATSGVPGFKREEVRLSPEEVERYAEQLIDLTEAIGPKLVVLETGLEDPAVLVGVSAYSVDMVAAELLGIDPKDIATITSATSRGLGPAAPFEITVIDSLRS
jgi:uncharacterized protein (DUF362 family)